MSEQQQKVVTIEAMQKAMAEWERKNFGAARPLPDKATVWEMLKGMRETAQKGGPEAAELIDVAFGLGKLSLSHALPILGMVEELGELCHAVLKQSQGIRGTYEEHEAAQRDAIGDIGLYRMSFASAKGWSLSEIDVQTFLEVMRRDWKANPVNGAAPALRPQAEEPAQKREEQPTNSWDRMISFDALNGDVWTVRCGSINRVVRSNLEDGGRSIVFFTDTDGAMRSFSVPIERAAVIHRIYNVSPEHAERLE